MKKRVITFALCLAMLLSTVAVMFGCGGSEAVKPDAFVIMTDSLDGLFNPFYSTSGNDAKIVAMTQLGMLTTDLKNGEVVEAYGDDYAVVVKDFSSDYNAEADQTVYTFVLKNNIVFSDGHPLTMEDVLFNMYVYLDPVYTGSSTMYSTDIVGLRDYRTQTISSGTTGGTEDAINTDATNRATNRINELINLFQQVGKTATAGSYSADYTKMVEAIKNHGLSNGYKQAVSADPSSVTNDQLLADYEETLRLFKEELGRDYVSAKDAYTEEPYKSHEEFKDEVFCFMYTEGFVGVEYARGADGKYDKTKIERLIKNYNPDVAKDKASAIDYVYNSKISTALHEILRYWATATELRTDYTAKAKEVILAEKMTDGKLTIDHITGIESLAHNTDETQVVINDTTYAVAQEHDANGKPVNANEYDVLRITINGVDPKAVWNFSFSVAPQHYYAEGYTVDIANNNFGVDYGSYDYMTKVIQSTRNVKVPMGAGAYMATDRDNAENPDGSNFYSDNVVYFKRNDKFLMGQPKIEKIRYKVVSTSNAIYALEEGSVHFIEPQFTQNNIQKLDSMKSNGIMTANTKQLGYGYIGVNAGKVPNIYVRKAIMAAMDTAQALSYYSVGMAEQIYWPMSTVSWAYPTDEQGNPDRINNHDYPILNFSKDKARDLIEGYMAQAGVSEGDSALDLTFTIAGADLTDHPTYMTFRSAADMLNEMGWNVQVVADPQALTKLATGSLEVWAAAWGTTVDPDMYQVYHKNSTATSVLAWGYREILASPALYPEETAILNELSALIDDARETNDKDIRKTLYKQAMGKVLDLAVELPVYQRQVLYAYNANVIKAESLPSDINPYTSPLDKIWEIEFAD